MSKKRVWASDVNIDKWMIGVPGLPRANAPVSKGDIFRDLWRPFDNTLWYGRPECYGRINGLVSNSDCEEARHWLGSGSCWRLKLASNCCSFSLAIDVYWHSQTEEAIHVLNSLIKSVNDRAVGKIEGRPNGIISSVKACNFNDYLQIAR